MNKKAFDVKILAIFVATVIVLIFATIIILGVLRGGILG